MRTSHHVCTPHHVCTFLAVLAGNVDTPVLGRVIERGLAADGRIHRLRVWVSDRPGGIASLTALISSVGVSVKDVHHERAWCVVLLPGTMNRYHPLPFEGFVAELTF